MNIYLVQFLNEAREAEAEMVTTAENAEEVVKVYQKQEIYKYMKEDDVLSDVITKQITGPILYVGFPMQGV